MTLNKLKELYFSIFLATAILIVDLSYRWSSHLDMAKLVDKAVDYSSISFGFLLTVLAILLQSNTKAIIRIKHANRFNDLIKANKKGVIASLSLVFISIFYLSVSSSEIINMIVYDDLSIKLLFNSIFLSVFAYQFIEVVLFLEVFYIAIRD